MDAPTKLRIFVAILLITNAVLLATMGCRPPRQVCSYSPYTLKVWPAVAGGKDGVIIVLDDLSGLQDFKIEVTEPDALEANR